MQGPLPTVAALPVSGGGLANPATAVALSNRPTPTPNYTECPVPDEVDMAGVTPNARAMIDEIARFLSAGGSPVTLENHLRTEWRVLGETGVVRSDLDLTGEGTPDVLLTMTAPDDGGTMVLLTCTDGRYAVRYQYSAGGGIPQLIQIGDMNFDNTPEILFTAEVCAEETNCANVTQLITWQGRLGRFVSLLGGEIESVSVPSVSDVDNDQIGEVVLRLDNPGTAETGPLRTGVTIYDWNGAGYVQSVTQLDPPRFRIQVIHEADRALERLNADEAIGLYQLAQTSPALEPWRNDEAPILESYLLYRLLLAYAYTASEALLPTYQTLLERFPDATTAPVYVPLATTFWNAFQVTNNLRSACLEVREFIATRPEALDLMNSYGSQSPVYTDNTLCPF